MNSSVSGRFRAVSAAERFHGSYVVNPAGCWVWARSTDTAGYGRLRVDGRLMQAHRAALLLAGVELPTGAEVTHRCGVRRCVNPDHLQQTTRTTNPTRSLAVPHRAR
jgi:HNH endonuclease